MSPPPSLFKYESCTVQALQNLKDQRVFFGSPLNFNDPYDCALSPTVQIPTDADIEKIRAHYLLSPNISPKARRELETFSPYALRLSFLRAGQNVLDEAIKQFLACRGVTCFSESNSNLLMWSHYGGQGKGFCLEFDSDTELFRKARRVRYSKTMPEIDIVPLICGDSSEQILDLYCTKGADWKYEQEWRCIHNESDKPFGYPDSALKAVYFGPNTSFTAFEIISLILRGQNANAKLMRGTRSKSEFSVLFEEVVYTPHLEAKKLGLVPKADA